MQSRIKKTYSESFKISVVNEVLLGKKSAYEIRQEYKIGGKMTVYRWISKYGISLPKKSTKTMKKQKSKGSLPKKNKKSNRSKANKSLSLEEALIKIELYETMLDIAKKDYGIDVKKKLGSEE